MASPEEREKAYKALKQEADRILTENPNTYVVNNWVVEDAEDGTLIFHTMTAEGWDRLVENVAARTREHEAEDEEEEGS